MEVKKDGVGTYSIAFEKKESGVWAFLFKNEEVVGMWEEVMEREPGVKEEYVRKVKEVEAARASLANATKSE